MKILSIPVLSALFCVYFFWGTTYLAMQFALQSLPPYLMLASRFGPAGLIMYIVLRLLKVEAPTRGQWKSSAIIGAVLLLLSTGSITISMAEAVVPSNIAATINAAIPLWVAFFQWTIFKKGAPGFWTKVGLIMGFIGVAMLVSSSGSKTSGGALWGYILLVFAAAMWALGSLMSSVSDLPKSQFMVIAAQMMFGAVFCFIAGVLKGEIAEINIDSFSMNSIIAILYLITFGSIVGYSSYIWLLRNTSPALASTYAYVNPVVAIFMGWLLAGETLIMQEIISVSVILFAVIAIIKENSKIKAKVN